MDYKDYTANVLKYQEMENYQFPEGATQDEVISKLREFSAEKKKIQDSCNGIIEEYIGKYEKNPELLDDAAAEELQKFADILFEQGSNGGKEDTSIVYHIYKLLFRYYEEKEMLEETVSVLVKLTSCEDEFNTHLSLGIFHEYSKKVEQYVKYFEQLSVSGKQKLLSCYLTDFDMRPAASEQVAQYKRKKDFLEKAKQGMSGEFDESLEKTFLIAAAGVISTRRAQEDDAIRTGKKAAGECTNLSQDKEMKELLKKIKNIVEYSTGRTNQKIKIYYLNLAYQTGEITLDEMLSRIKELTKVNPEDDIYSQWAALFLMNACYMTYLQLYSLKPGEEIKKESEEIVDKVMSVARELASGEMNKMLNYYLMMFICGSSYNVDEKIFKKVVLDSTVYANKALYVHTMMVKEISAVLLAYLLKNDVDYLDGVADYDTDYIKAHPQEIMEIMEDCALLHDVGKYPCLDYTSLSYRRLAEEEFEIIKHHPENYEQIYSGTMTRRGECVRDCALLHHRWFNGKGGYPEREHTKNKPFVGILSIADSIDAALDTIGRPYGEGKTLDNLIAEFETMRDTRYSSRVIDALIQPEVKEKVEYILKVKQEEINYEVYQKVK